MIYWQGLTFPVSEFYLEDVLEKTRYEIQELDSFQGNSRQRRREQYSKKDPITELFEACLNSLNYIFFYLYLSHSRSHMLTSGKYTVSIAVL